MKTMALSVSLLVLFVLPAAGQTQDVKVIADTIVVQAEGTYAADPDLATVEFDISTQEKELKRAYDNATQSLRRIVELAERNGLKKEEISTGVLTVVPLYEGDRKRKTRAYVVQGRVVLRVRDFSRIGPILDDSLQDGIADFRSLTYSLADEEAAKQLAVAEAMRRAVGRATVALEQKKQKLGTLRYATLDVRQLVGVARMEAMQVMASETALTVGRAKAVSSPPFPATRPEKITVAASIQCLFQIQ
jgi:uncharacterized protein YggE